jgi:hypothetical protein
MHVGLTQGKLQNIFSILEKIIGKAQSDAAKAVLTRVVTAKH